MAFAIFDGVNKVITLESGVTAFNVIDLYSLWKLWFQDADHSKYLPAFRSVGGDPISETKVLGSTYFLINGWRIRPQEANHRLIVNGNLYTDPAGFSPFIDTLGNYNVTIELTVSNLSDSSIAQIDQINAAVYRGEVALRQTSSFSGTVFPMGTHEFPVNNIDDAIVIANSYGINTINLGGTVVFGADDISGFTLKGENAITTTLSFTAATNLTNSTIEDLFIVNSAFSGRVYVKHCSIRNVSNLIGYVENSIIGGTIDVDDSGIDSLYFVDCKSACVGVESADLPVLDMSGTNQHVAFRNFSGPIKIINSTDTNNTLCLDITSGSTIIIDSTCTAGKLFIRGIAEIVNNGTMEIDVDGQIDKASISTTVWSAPTTGYASGTMGYAQSQTSGLSEAQANMLLELYNIMGLDPTKPLIVTNTSRTAGTITQTIDTTPASTTVQRQ